jgi:hypothetical protein
MEAVACRWSRCTGRRRQHCTGAQGLLLGHLSVGYAARIAAASKRAKPVALAAGSPTLPR